MVEFESLYMEGERGGGTVGTIILWMNLLIIVSCHFYPIHETKYIDMPSPGASLSTPGDRQHVDKQAFPWDPSEYTRVQTTHRGQTSLPLVLFSEYTRGQTTQGHRNLLLAPIWVCQETDYIKTNKSSPGAPLNGPGYRLHKDRQVFPRSPSQNTGRQTTFKKTSLPLGPFQGAPEDRLHIQVFPWITFQNTRRQTTQTQQDKPLTACQGKALCVCVVCPLVYFENVSRGRLLSLCSLSPGLLWEGFQGKTCLLYT